MMSRVIINFQAGITHTNNNDKTSISFLWIAPAKGTGPIQFGYIIYSITLYACSIINHTHPSTYNIIKGAWCAWALASNSMKDIYYSEC